MRWGLVLSLSMFGLAMALGTIVVIPPRVAEPLWVVIFLVTSFIVAKRADRLFFLHGFLVGLSNWAWVTAAHVAFHSAYVAHHAADIAARQAMAPPALPAPLAGAFAFMQAYDVPIPGASGLIYGALSWLGSKVLRRGAAARPAA